MLLIDRIKKSPMLGLGVTVVIMVVVYTVVTIWAIKHAKPVEEAKDNVVMKEVPVEVIKNVNNIDPRISRGYSIELDKDMINSLSKYCNKVNLILSVNTTINSKETIVNHMVENIGLDDKSCNYHLRIKDNIE